MHFSKSYEIAPCFNLKKWLNVSTFLIQLAPKFPLGLVSGGIQLHTWNVEVYVGFCVQGMAGQLKSFPALGSKLGSASK